MTAATDRIATLLNRAPVFDGHNDVAWALRRLVAGRPETALDGVDLGAAQPALHTDVPRLRAGGVGAQFLSVYVPGTLSGGAAVTAVLEQIDCAHRIIARHPKTFRFCRSADDVRAAHASGRIGALLGAEGGHSIDDSLAVLRMLDLLGVAYMTLTHNENTPWADSATDVPAVDGLNDRGRQVVAEMNRLGMLVDLSHVAATTMHAALDATRAPVLFSHSSCRAVTDHVRNVPDDVLERLPANGGVVMVTFVPDFVSQACADHTRAQEAQAQRLGLSRVTVYTQDDGRDHDPGAVDALRQWQAAHPRPRATVTDVADHVEHARAVAGPAHIGLGGDYDGTADLPDGLSDVSGYPALLSELAERGWSDADLAALTWGNALRVLGAAQDVASSGDPV
ncbi:membrane dipeptidase [Nakamurella flava]|uniref:Membrane dipeptidase n=1 Tax=Nakamurella flava TaxID=2576308 RepID=A0A4U6QE72_9ACTN|nr:dipeptidase [Nakamurella flava]TKV58537.1 membrane dipeptidase [Nakamurella flava]